MDAKQAIWEAMGWAEDADPITPTPSPNPLTPSAPGANPASPASPTSGGAGGKSVGEMLSELEKHDKQSHRGGYKGGRCIYRAKLAQAGYDMAAHDAKLGNFVPSDPSEYGDPNEEEDASDADASDVDASDASADNPVPLEQPVEKTIGDIELTAKTEGAAVALEALEKIVRDPNGDPELVAKAQEALFRLSQDPSVQKEPPAAQNEAAAANTEPTGGAGLSPDVPRDIQMTDDEFAKLMSDESAAASINAEIAEYKDALKEWAKEGALPGPDYIINPTSLQGRMVAKALEEVTQELSATPSEGGLIGKPISDSDFEQMKLDVVLGGVVKKTRDYIKAQLEQASQTGEPVSFPFEKGTLEDRLLEEVKAELRSQGLKLKDEGEPQPPESTEGPTPEKTAEPEKPDADGEEVKEGAESQKPEVDADGVEYDDISIEASTPEEGGELPTTSPDEGETSAGGPTTGTSESHPVSKLSEEERREAWDALGQSFRDAVMAIKGDKDDAAIDSLINKIAVIGQKRKVWAQTKDVTPSRQSVRDSLNKVLDEDVEQSKDETTLDRMNKFIKDTKIPREIRDIITSLRDRLQDPFISNANKLKTLEKFASVVKKNKLDEGGGTKEGTVPGYVDDGDDNHRTGGVTSSEKMSDKPAVFKVDPNNSKITAGKYNQEKEAVDKVTDDAAQFGIDPSDINVKRKVNTTEISIGLPDNITDADVKRLKDQLAAKFPGLRTTEVNDGPGQKKTVVENVFFIHDPYNQTLTVRMHNDVKGNVPHAALVNSDKFKEALAKGQVAATFAANDKGEPIIIDFRELPHIMFAGTSGAGKNARMDATITSLMAGKSPRDVQFLFVDGKGGGASFGKYKNSPYALLPVTDRQGAIQRVNFLINEMNNRDKLFNRLGVEDLKEYNEKMDQLVAEGKAPEGMPTHLPDIFLSIDEFGNVRNTLGAKKFDAAVAQLGNQGRSTGCHLMLATQNPTDEGGVSPNLKANLSTIVGMRTTNSIASHSILGETGLESLSKKGPVAIKTDEGVQYADGSYISNSEIAGGLPIKENPPETAKPTETTKPIPTEIAKTPAEEAALNNIMGSIGNGKGVKVAEGRAAEMARQYIQSIGLEYEEQKTADGKVLIKAKPLQENKSKGSASGEVDEGGSRISTPENGRGFLQDATRKHDELPNDKIHKFDAANRWLRKGDSGWGSVEAEPGVVDAFKNAANHGGADIPSHGFGKDSTLQGGLNRLFTLLKDGVDANRGGGKLFHAALSGNDASSGTAGGAYKDGPLMLLGSKGSSFTGKLENLKAVLVNDFAKELIPDIQEAISKIRPDIKVFPYSEADKAAQFISSQPETNSTESKPNTTSVGGASPDGTNESNAPETGAGGTSESGSGGDANAEGASAESPAPEPSQFEQQISTEKKSFSGDKQRFAVAHGAFSEAVSSAKSALQRALASAKSDKAKVEAYHKHDMAIAQALANLNAYRNQVGLPSAELHEGVVSLPQPDAGKEETPAETASEAQPNAFLNEEVKNSLGSDLQKAEYDSAARSANNAYQTYLSALGGDDDKAKDEALKGYQEAVSRLNGILSKNGQPEIDVETGKSRTPTEPATATEVSESAEATQEPQVEPTSEDIEGYFDSEEITSIKSPVFKDKIESNAQALKKAYDEFNKAPKNSDAREKAGDRFLKLLKSDNVLRKKLKLRQRDEDGTLLPSEQPVTGEETQAQKNASETVSQPNQYLVQGELQGVSEFNKPLLTRAAKDFQKAKDTFSKALESDGTLDVDKAIKKYDKAVSAYNKIREGMGLKPVNRETGFAEGVKPDNKGPDKPTDPDQPPKGPDNPTGPGTPPQPDTPTAPTNPEPPKPEGGGGGNATIAPDTTGGANTQSPEQPEQPENVSGNGATGSADNKGGTSPTGTGQTANNAKKESATPDKKAEKTPTSTSTTTTAPKITQGEFDFGSTSNTNIKALKDNYDKAVKDHGTDSKKARDAKAALEETTKRLVAAQNTVKNKQGTTTGEQKAPPVAAPTGKKPPAKTGSKPKKPTNGDGQGVKIKMNYLSDPSPAESAAMINEIRKLAGQDSKFRDAKKQKDALVKARQAETDPVKQQSLDAEIAKAEANRINLLREIGNQLVGPRGLTLNEKGRIVVDRTAAEKKIQQGLESGKKKSSKAKATTDELPTENVWNDLFLAAFNSFQEGEKTSSGLV